MFKIQNKESMETKLTFYGQYINQKVCYVTIDDAEDAGPFRVNMPDWKVRHTDSYLLLTSIDDISDDVAIDFLYVIEDKEFADKKTHEEKIAWGRSFIDSFKTYRLSPQDYVRCADFLRLRGVALPWYDISVEEQISLGWIKLKKQ